MKKRVLMVLLLIAVAVGYHVMPKVVESSIPTAYYITPNRKTYENVVNCTGTIQSADVQQVYLQSTVVAGNVDVSVGDMVQKGDRLLTIDSERTNLLRDLPLNLVQETVKQAEPSGGVDWAALAADYGLSAVISGNSADVDIAALEGLLQDSGLITGIDSTVPAGTDGQGSITAPISGVVTSVEIQKGMPTAAGKGIITIADVEQYKVLVSIREEDIARVQIGDRANVRGVAFSGATYTGTVVKIHPTARKALSGTTTETVVDAEIVLDRPDNRLKPGFSAKVEIIGGGDYQMVTVPYEAIKQDADNNEYVYLYEGGKLKRQQVVTGQELTSEVEILEGVSQDSVVVYNPSDQIKEGAMVHIKGRANVD